MGSGPAGGVPFSAFAGSRAHKYCGLGLMMLSVQSGFSDDGLNAVS